MSRPSITHRLVVVLTVVVWITSALVPAFNAEPASWALYGSMIGVLLAGLVDVAVRVAHRASHPAVVAG